MGIIAKRAAELRDAEQEIVSGDVLQITVLGFRGQDFSGEFSVSAEGTLVYQGETLTVAGEGPAAAAGMVRETLLTGAHLKAPHAAVYSTGWKPYVRALDQLVSALLKTSLPDHFARQSLSPADQDDAIQETAQKLWVWIAAGEAEVGMEDAFTRRVAMSMATNFYRKHRRRREVHVDDFARVAPGEIGAPGLERVLVEKEEERDVVNRVRDLFDGNCLAASYRDALWKRHALGQSMDDLVTQDLQEKGSPNNVEEREKAAARVYARLSRGSRRLRQLLLEAQEAR